MILILNQSLTQSKNDLFLTYSLLAFLQLQRVELFVVLLRLFILIFPPEDVSHHAMELRVLWKLLFGFIPLQKVLDFHEEFLGLTELLLHEKTLAEDKEQLY